MTWKDEIKKSEDDLPPEITEAIKVAVQITASSFKGLSDDMLYSLLGPSRSTKGDKNYASTTELVLDYVDKFRENLIATHTKTWDELKE